MLVVALIAAQVAVGMPSISIIASGDGYAAEAPEFDGQFAEAVEREVASRAFDICAGKSVDWGKFRFDQQVGKKSETQPMTFKAYRREFKCVASANTDFIPAPADWVATDTDKADVRHIFETYYARRDAGDMTATLAMFQSGTIGDPVSWSKEVSQSNEQLGSGHRRITAISWEVNPEAASRPGVYAAIDFVGDYKAVHFYCGYLGLYRLGPGTYKIVHEEQNRFVRGKEQPDPQQLAQMRAAACREG